MCLVDADLQPVRQVVDTYMAQGERCANRRTSLSSYFDAGFEWIFHEQVLQYSTQGREKSYQLVAEAILRAVASGGSRPKVKAAPKKEPAADKKQPPSQIHSTESLVDQLKAALLDQYGSAKDAFDALSNADGIVGKKEWKRAVLRLLPKLTVQDNKSLRKSLAKRLPKKTDVEAFVRFFNSTTSDTQEMKAEESESQNHSSLAKLPDEVPEVRTDNLR